MVATKWIRFTGGLFAVVIVLAACNRDDGGGGSAAATGGLGDATGSGTTITIEDSAFDPDTITVSGATEVTITNRDSFTHTFTLDDGSVSELIAGGERVTVTIDVSETTGWLCNIHPGMTGTIEVG